MLLDQAGLAPGGLVLVDHALRGGLVDAHDRQAGQLLDVLLALLRGGGHGLGAGLELGANGLVAHAALLVLLVALDLALDVRHGVSWISGAEGAGARRERSQRP